MSLCFSRKFFSFLALVYCYQHPLPFVCVSSLNFIITGFPSNLVLVYCDIIGCLLKCSEAMQLKILIYSYIPQMIWLRIYPLLKIAFLKKEENFSFYIFPCNKTKHNKTSCTSVSAQYEVYWRTLLTPDANLWLNSCFLGITLKGFWKSQRFSVGVSTHQANWSSSQWHLI